MTDLEDLETTIDFHKMYESGLSIYLSIAAYENSHLCGVKGGENKSKSRSRARQPCWKRKADCRAPREVRREGLPRRNEGLPVPPGRGLGLLDIQHHTSGPEILGSRCVAC